MRRARRGSVSTVLNAHRAASAPSWNGAPCQLPIELSVLGLPQLGASTHDWRSTTAHAAPRCRAGRGWTRGAGSCRPARRWSCSCGPSQTSSRSPWRGWRGWMGSTPRRSSRRARTRRLRCSSACASSKSRRSSRCSSTWHLGRRLRRHPHLHTEATQRLPRSDQRGAARSGLLARAGSNLPPRALAAPPPVHGVAQLAARVGAAPRRRPADHPRPERSGPSVNARVAQRGHYQARLRQPRQQR